MFNYNPADVQTIDNTFPAGKYQAVIEKVEQTTSKKSGAPMLKVALTVYSGEKSRIVYDYIVNPSTLFKLKSIAHALGQDERFNAGKFDLEKHIGSNLTVKLSVKQEPGYDPKNDIRGYYPFADTVQTSTDQDVPF